jgi:hypothetical protein
LSFIWTERETIVGGILPMAASTLAPNVLKDFGS